METIQLLWKELKILHLVWIPKYFLVSLDALKLVPQLLECLLPVKLQLQKSPTILELGLIQMMQLQTQADVKFEKNYNHLEMDVMI